MILILSKDEENTTDDVIEWLICQNAIWKRVNGSELYPEFRINSLPFPCEDNSPNKILPQQKISAVWLRRWNDLSFLNSYIPKNQLNDYAIKSYIRSEQSCLSNYYFSQLKDCYWLSQPENANVNKLIVLQLAQKYHLNIPDSIITNKKSHLLEFLRNHHSIITKDLSNGAHFYGDECSYLLYTKEITKEDIKTLEEYFHPTFFQEKIDKKYEIRTFYLEGNFYSMAIFSQSDKKTDVDFRMYNYDKPNRTVPYKLPTEIEQKLDDLMKKMGLNTGSIDLIVTNDLNFIFLEINPVGQFGMVSRPCNYYLEEKVANVLNTQNKI